jgi:hypothetical protein
VPKDAGLLANDSFWERPRNLGPQPVGTGETITVDTTDPDAVRTPEDGVQVIKLPDGVVRFDFSGRGNLDEDGEESDDSRFDQNLAMLIDQAELATIAEDLLEGIDADKRSRDEWLTSREKAIKLLGLKIEEPRSEPGGGSDGSSLQGMSTVKDPALTEAVIRGQANAIGEFLPSGGPVKIEDEGNPPNDPLAEQLEKDFNVYLTTVATEYYPDTRRMLAWCYFGGSGVKKVYHCPLRNRPVSESVPMEDFIVSNAATDLQNADRVTHQITMRVSQFRRMVLADVYRDVETRQPVAPEKDAVTQALESVEGVRTDNTRPEDQPYTLFETCCELDIDRFASGKFKGKGVPLPYKVTIEKDSRSVVALYRHWKEDDEECRPRELYVKWCFIDWIGFYGLGLLHVMGNLTLALTGMLRIAIDNGMFANFPGGLAARDPAGKQESNLAPVGPGQFRMVDMGGVDDIRKVVMGLPYKDISQGMLAVIQMVHGYAQRVGGTADLPIGEGKQDAPVGTTLALLEQATRVESAVHKGMHQSQAKELQLLIELFREDPEAFWRHRKPKKKRPNPWTQQTLLQAMDDYDLVPKSDPNTPSHIHRVMKAVARLQMAQSAPPGLFDLKKVFEEAMRVLGDANPDQYFAPPQAPAPPAPDPNLIKAQAAQQVAATKDFQAKSDAQNEQAKLQNEAADRATESSLADKKLATELVIHGQTQAQDQQNTDRSHGLATAQHGLALKQHGLDALQAAHSAAMDTASLSQPSSGGANEP